MASTDHPIFSLSKVKAHKIISISLLISMCRRRPTTVLFLTCIQLFLAHRVSGETDPIVNLENVAGKLVFYQNEGNSTYVRDTGQLASAVQTVAMFEIFDPEQTLGKSKLTYTWDFGNGEVIEGTDPVVRYDYTESGNYTLRLLVDEAGTNLTKKEIPIAGVYTMDVKVLDVIKNIELEGPSSYQVAENITLLFHVDGSPPMWVCWQVLPECRAMAPVGCTPTTMYSHTLRLDHTFTSTGVHCLDINARNDISKLHTSYSLYIARSPYSNLFFILSCLAVLVATFSFIAVVACRPRFTPKVADSSNAIFLKNHQDTDVCDIKLALSRAERGETQPLICQQGLQYSI